MSVLHEELQAELEAARQQQNEYIPFDGTAEKIGDKTLLMVVGPAGVGKTTIMNRVTEMDSDFARVPVFCTREPRDDDDPGMFRTFEHSNASVREFLTRIQARTVVQYAIHPTQDTIYGTEPTDYTKPFNMLATLSGVVEGMRRIPFRDTVTFGVVADPNDWQHWFNTRFPHSHPDRAKRILEAQTSLSWLLNDRLTFWLHNETDNPSAAATDLIAAARYGMDGKDLRQQAEQMLKVAREL